MRYSTRKTALVVLLVALVGVGTVSVQAAPVCQRFVREYREHVAHHKVSPYTAARWALWAATHPDYKPKPKPKPRLTPEETVSKIDYDCEVPQIGTEEAFLLPPEPLGNLMMPTELYQPTPVAPAPPPFSLVDVPIGTTPVMSDTPEPGSWILVLTGLLGLVLYQNRRSKLASSDL